MIKYTKIWSQKKDIKETSTLGGIDPYSGSKAAAELVIHSYLNSYFFKKNKKISIATARAGNVIGGGDWAKNRLIPDCIKAWSINKKVFLRNPGSTRPWQCIRSYLGLFKSRSKVKI